MSEAVTPTTTTPTVFDPTAEAAEKALCFRGIWAWLVLILLIGLAVFAVMWLLRKFIQGPVYRKKNRIDGKVVIVTGCNTGIGKETVLELARRGAKIYMACRDPARCEAARIEIIDRTQNQQLFNRSLDLGSLESVRNFVARFKAEETRLDLLVNNAGIMACPRSLTADGYEQQFGVNHLGHFLLTNLLLDRLKQASPSRIVVVSSAAHLFGRINREDLMSERKYGKFFGAYSQSKLANILFTLKLSKLLQGSGVTVNCCHPGVVRTELNRHFVAPGWVKSCIQTLALYFMKSPQAGAQTSLRLALDPSLEGSSGDYYSDSMRFPLVPWARNMETADWLWRESEKLVGLPPIEPQNGGVQQNGNVTGNGTRPVAGGAGGGGGGESIETVVVDRTSS
ncbi:retinol dehydrogenase 12 [Drosophila sulfurigaster albostrigata]|uniref:retinol dehydrogenase 12 n=1 Tax=Drosophila sulfurigaster albostrigata TaxID=89887 RepID=UPI002D21C412|nr:retinol dehydrogenase 12 [Drosophila sulfurigaster albostrigata]XP_062138485.1 retinol dehydrogenase 12 [Drosophila sulfurigaster albostrigata]XP_062138487.1 retinol dehydrogenase 12 [Drosophila sulfurigaster albostrigata]